MPTLEHAIALAAHAHAGQTDKAGQPYILHPLRLMLSLRDPTAQIVAVLHDIIEDTPTRAEDLQQAGFSVQIVQAVLALSKTEGESRIDAAHRAAANPLARQVKLADVADNMNLGRIAQPSEKDYARLEQYKQVQAILLAAEPSTSG